MPEIPPAEIVRTCRIRILGKSSWFDPGDPTVQLPWEELQMSEGLMPGLELLFYEQVLLPQVGRAALVFKSGRYPDPDDGVTLRTAPNLDGWHIRIQAAPNDGELDEGEEPTWRTVYWGTVEYTERRLFAAADEEEGDVVYNCVDGFSTYNRVYLNKHQWYYKGDFGEADNHPGYNGAQGQNELIGNREPTGADNGLGYESHVFDGLGDPWTDEQVIRNVLNNVQNDDANNTTLPGMSLEVDAALAELLEGARAYPVTETTTAWDIIATVADRRRGKGALYVTWDDDEGAPNDLLVPKLKLVSQVYNNVEYVKPSTLGSTDEVVTINGATATGTWINYSVVGDHRYLENSLRLNQRSTLADYVEIQGERIQILVVLGPEQGGGSRTLQRRWDDDSETEYAADPTDPAYAHVYTAFGVAPNFDYKVGKGDGSEALTRCDYRALDNGAVVQPNPDDDVDTSPIMTDFMIDVPVYPGFVENLDDARESLQRTRYFPRVWIQDATDATIRSPVVAPREMRVATSQEISGNRPRRFDTTFNWETDLQISVALELPHRVRMAYGDPSGGRRKIIRMQGIHYWTAHPDAWLNVETKAPIATLTQPLRDDRDLLAPTAAMANEWYIEEHIPLSFTMRSNGFLTLGDDTLTGGGEPGGPRVGQVLHQFTLAGQTLDVDVPVSAMRYDHTQGTTNYQCDWVELDFSR